MTTLIRVLVVEDSADDAELLGIQLEDAGYDVYWERVETAREMSDALDARPWDVVLTDYAMPRFGGRAAIELLRATGLDIPIIVVSGTIGEALAVECMRAGASDYLLKDSLHRLHLVVMRALGDAASRAAHRKTQAELREYEHIVSTTTDMMALIDRNLAYKAVNAAYATAFNKAPSDLIGHTVTDVFGEEFYGAVIKPSAERCLGGELVTYSAWFDLPAGRRYMEIHYFPYIGKTDKVEGFVVNARDATALALAEERRDVMEKQMRAAQRMEAVGRLAGGVAHDFNNILTVIQSYAELLREQFREGDPARDDIDAVLDASGRAARLTNQLLAFSRRQPQQLSIVNLAESISEVHGLLQRLLGEDIDLVAVLDEDLGLVTVDRSQLEQVLMNLAVNARDAMPDGGKLTIETANAVLDESVGKQRGVTVPPGKYVSITVWDTGDGMDAETVSHAFEPFFTTKGSQGTGLGLATVYGIVKQSSGFIWIDSEPGKGTRVEVYLPTVDAEEPTASTEARPAVELGGTETVLFVEDEEMLRDVCSRVLSRNGYNVLQGTHGGDALLVCERYQGEIHLLITDVVMPGMSGPELADRLAQLRPKMRVIYMSGYTEDAIAHRGVLDHGVVFVQKPFRPADLLRNVRETLDAA